MRITVIFLLLVSFLKATAQIPLIENSSIKVSIAVEEFENKRSYLSRELEFNENGKILQEISYSVFQNDSIKMDEVSQSIYEKNVLVKTLNWRRIFNTSEYVSTFSINTFNTENKLSNIATYNSDNQLIRTETYTEKEGWQILDDPESSFLMEWLYDDKKRVIGQRNVSKSDNVLLAELKKEYMGDCWKKTLTYFSPESKIIASSSCYDEKTKTKTLISDTSKSIYKYDTNGFLTQNLFYTKKSGKENLYAKTTYKIKFPAIVPDKETIKLINNYILAD